MRGFSFRTIVLGQHIHAIKAGVVALSGGPTLTAVDSFEIRIFGKSGHISRPDICVDPVITAAHIVVRLQSIVTKETRPEVSLSWRVPVYVGEARRTSCLT